MDRSTLPYRDPRVDQLMEDPKRYFVQARARAYAQARRIVEADLAQLTRAGYPEPRSATNGAVQ